MTKIQPNVATCGMNMFPSRRDALEAAREMSFVHGPQVVWPDPLARGVWAGDALADHCRENQTLWIDGELVVADRRNHDIIIDAWWRRNPA